MTTHVLLKDKQWKKFFGKMNRNLKDTISRLETLCRTIGYANIQDHFKKEEGSTGKWKPRKATTQQAYARLNKKNKRYSPSNKLLQLSGNLRKSLMRKTGDIKRVGNKGVLMYTDIPYSNRQNTDRDFMFLTDDCQQKIVDSLIEWVSGIR